MWASSYYRGIIWHEERGLNEVISLLCLKSMYMMLNTHIHGSEYVYSNIHTHIHEGDSRGVITVSYHCTHWSPAALCAAPSAPCPLRNPFSQIAPGLLLHISSLWYTASKLFLIEPSLTDYCRMQVIGTKLRNLYLDVVIIEILNFTVWRNVSLSTRCLRSAIRKLWFVNHNVNNKFRYHSFMLLANICIRSFNELLKNKPFMQACVIRLCKIPNQDT